MLCKAKGPTCSCPSPRNMKPEKRMQGRGRRGETGDWRGRRSWLEEQEMRNGSKKMSRQKKHGCIWNIRLSNMMLLGDTWSKWHSIWESPEAALPERTGFLRSRRGCVWVLLALCQCPLMDWNTPEIKADDKRTWKGRLETGHSPLVINLNEKVKTNS